MRRALTVTAAANNITDGTDGTAGRRYMGPLPATGQWVRLEVPASQVGMEGQTAIGMGFSLYNGRATWDYGTKGCIRGSNADLKRMIELIQSNKGRKIRLTKPNY